MESQNKLEYKTITFENLYTALEPNITTTKNGVVFYNSSNSDEDNAFFQKLQDAYRKSSVHSNFIKLKSNLTYSTGLFPYESTNTALQEFIETENIFGENLDKVFKKSAFDVSIYDSAAFQVIYNKGGKIAEVYHVNPANVRAEEPNEQGVVENYYISNSWGVIDNARNRKKANNIDDAEPIAAFNPAKYKQGKQLLYLKNYNGTNDIYGQPQYLAALNFIELEYSLSNYIVNKVKNGYYPSGILYIPSNMSDPDKDKFVRQFKGQHQGETNAGEIIFAIGDMASGKPEFLKLTDDLGNSLFQEYISTSQQQIAYAHGGNMSLLGLDKGDSFGGSADANKLNITRLAYINSVIVHQQNLILEGLNKILKVNGLGKITVNNETLKIQQPITTLEDLTEDERRELVYGLPPKPVSQNINSNNPVV